MTMAPFVPCLRRQGRGWTRLASSLLAVVLVASASLANGLPWAEAGPDQSVVAGTAGQLDGAASGGAGDGQTLGFHWAAPPGLVLSDSTAAQPSFTAPAARGLYVVYLVVDVEQVFSDPDSVVIQVTNAAPVLATVGDPRITLGSELNLPLVATDINGDTLTWAAVGAPPGAAVVGSAFLWKPELATLGDWYVTFRVTDGHGGSDEESVTVHGLPVAVWTTGLTVTSAAGQRLGLRFGLAEGATDAIDPYLGEDYLPPTPVGQILDARFLAAGPAECVLDLRAADQTWVIWPLHVQAGESGGTFTLSWDPAELPADGGFRLQDRTTGSSYINIDMRSQSSLQTDWADLQIAHGATVEVTYPDGWQLVSLPLAGQWWGLWDNLFGGGIHNLGGYYYAYYGYGFDLASGYGYSNTMAMGRGYWVKQSAPFSHTFIGQAPYGVVVELAAGWNLVGPGSVTLDVAELKVAYPDIQSVYDYSPRAGYRRATRLQPGYGYWVRSAGQTVVDLGGQVAPWSPAARVADASMPPASALYFEGPAAAQEIALGIPPEAVEPLPPVPPAGMLDARVDLGQGVQAAAVPADGRDYGLRVQGDITRVRWELAPGTFWVLTLDGTELTLTGSGQRALPPGATLRLRSGAAAPSSTRLHGAYPNPFNPQTTIAYDLAQAGPVQVSVFAVTGQPVRHLVNEPQAAGSYQVPWDGRDEAGKRVASGVYLVELRAGAYRAVRTLALVR